MAVADSVDPRMVFPQRRSGQEPAAIRHCLIDSDGRSVLAAGDQITRHDPGTTSALVLSGGTVVRGSGELRNGRALLWSDRQLLLYDGRSVSSAIEPVEPAWHYDAAVLLNNLALATARRDELGKSRLNVYRDLSRASSSLMVAETPPDVPLWMNAFGADAFALGRRDGAVDLWRAASSRVTHVELFGHTGAVAHGAVVPGDSYLITAADDLTVRIWTITTEPTLLGGTSAACSGHTDAITGIAITPDGQCVATSSRDRTIRLWGIPDGRNIAVLTEHRDWVTHVAVNPTGTHLASCSEDGTVKLWDLHTHECIGTTYGVSRFLCLAMSADTVFAGDAAGNLWMLQYGDEDRREGTSPFRSTS